MTIDEQKILIALGDQVYAALQLALLVGKAGREDVTYHAVVIGNLSVTLDYLRTLTKRDVGNN